MDTDTFYMIFISLMVFILLVTSSHQEKVCPRDKSRVVAKVVREKLFPAFNALQLEPSPKCQFSLRRDTYSTQEDHKISDSSGSRWTCNFCGKAFITEYYIDKHFENRHPDQVQTGDVICLADVCDVFRCDIISGAAQPDYWDIALCLEADMEELLSQCQRMVDGCIPVGLTRNETDTLKANMMENVCSFLTCSKYWDRPMEGETNSHLALYIVLTTMTIFGIFIYNFIFYNYFFSDFGENGYDPSPRHKYRIKKYQKQQREHRRVGMPSAKHRGEIMDMLHTS